LGLASTSFGQQQTTGDAARGAGLFTTRFKCYACHGYDAQTGERRLQPMRYTQDAFIAFVQHSPLPQMPAYPDAGTGDLADIYAYILSLPIDAPDVANVPLLKEILDAKLAAME
jgi:mono/diheme cytochrome c family protein